MVSVAQRSLSRASLPLHTRQQCARALIKYRDLDVLLIAVGCRSLGDDRGAVFVTLCTLETPRRVADDTL